MSESINNTFPFSKMEDSEELDVASIFGGGDPASDINPFDLPAAQAEQSATPQEQPPPILFRRPLTSRKLRRLRWRPNPCLRSRRSLRTRA